MPTKVNQKASSFKLFCGAICPTKISHSFANYVLVLYGDECICRAIWGHHFITLLMLVLCGGNIWGALKDISYKVKFSGLQMAAFMVYSCSSFFCRKEISNFWEPGKSYKIYSFIQGHTNTHTYTWNNTTHNTQNTQHTTHKRSSTQTLVRVTLEILCFWCV